MVKSIIGSLIGAAAGLGIHYGIQQSTGESYVWFPLVVGLLTGLVSRMVAGKASSNMGQYASGFFAAIIALAGIYGFDFLTNMKSEENYEPINPTKAVAKSENTDDEKGEEGSAVKDENKAEDDQPVNEDQADDNEATSDSTADDSNEEATGADGDSEEPKDANRSDPPTSEMHDRSNQGAPSNLSSKEMKEANERFAEMIGKPTHQSGLNFYLPHIFSGIGALIAYQLARGFGSAPKPEVAQTEK